MDEDLSIINSNTRNERIKNFFIKNKRKLISFCIFIILFILIFFGFNEFNKSKKINISDNYNSIIIQYSENSKKKTADLLMEIINERDPTYSPLSLYFILDNNLLEEAITINELFDILIQKTPLENEIKNLIIYKKALYNSDKVGENDLLNILNPLFNSNSIWKSHALYLMAEFFYSKNEKEKSKDFFNQILIIENPNQDILRETQKRLNRDLSE